MISLTEEGKKLSFSEFKKTHAFYFKDKPKLDPKKVYEELTGKKVGSKKAIKQNKEV